MKRTPLLLSLVLGACSLAPTASPPPLASPSAIPSVSAPMLGEIPWMSAARTWTQAEVPMEEYTRLAGVLPEPEPTISIQVPMASLADRFEIGREPAAGMGLDGTIAYVADDGRSSTIHLLTIGDGGDSVVAEVPQVVGSAAVSPSGDTIYLLVMDRRSGDDAGVLAVAADGGPATRLMGPAQTRATGGNMLVAPIAFQGTLIPSLEGGLLARRVCTSVGGFGCGLDVLDLRTGEVSLIAGRPSERVTGLSDRFRVTADCAVELCTTTVTELATGAQQAFHGAFDGSSVTLLDRRLVLASAARAVDPPGSRIWLTWPDTGEQRELMQTGGETLFYLEMGLRWRAILPAGWILVERSEPGGVHHLAVWAEDATSVEIPAPHDEMPRPPGG